MRKSILLLAVISTLGAVARADEGTANPFTGNISVTTNYKFRGQDQGDLPAHTLRPAVQGGFDWTGNGWYVGNWNSSIGWVSGASVEMDFYGGYRGQVTKDLSYDIGVLRYQYPGAGKANTTEVYGMLGYGPLSLKYSDTVSRDYFGDGAARNYSGRNTGYVDLSGNFPVANELTVNAHLGYTRYASDLRDGTGIPNYTDYKLGLTCDMSKLNSGLSISGAVVGASNKGYYGDINKTRFIATLTKTL